MADSITTGQVISPLPRITIQFCTQCKWMLRAAYYAQELFSTFSTSLGEVALQPSTCGIFTITIHTAATAPSSSTTTEAQPVPELTNSEASIVQSRCLWDRKVDVGFPETKEIKRRVRDVIQPGRDLGHVDRDHQRGQGGDPPAATDTVAAVASSTDNGSSAAGAGAEKPECQDCQ